jgi:hypothetical protein
VADQSGNAAAELKADFRQLGGLAGPGFAADDHHLVVELRMAGRVAWGGAHAIS